MLWGATLRSPHPRARIRGIDLTEALTLPGVYAVLTHEDVPGAKLYGLERPDQPVLAIDEVRYQGEPVAIVAADHPETARRAAASITVDYEVLTPVADAELALRPGADAVHPTGNLLRHVPVRRGDPAATAEVVVSGEYQVGSQDQAFLGPESGLAVPAEDGGIDLYIATQWLHVDQKQVAACLGLPAEKVRLTLAGVGGAFGAREDLSMQVHASMLALRTGRPVKMVYGREESFFGHVHRHPATMRYEIGAHPDGELVYLRAAIVLDGGAYASSSTAVCANAATLGVGPVPGAQRRRWTRTSPTPTTRRVARCGASARCRRASATSRMMDRLATALGLDPVEVRVRNALATGDTMPTGQVVEGPAPVAQLLRIVASAPAPKPATDDLRELPGGVSNTTHGEGVVRGVGYAVSIKNVGFSEGFDDYASARVRLDLVGGSPAVVVHTAGRRGGSGPGHRTGADRTHRARRRAGHRRRRGHERRQRGLDLRVAADVHDRRCGALRRASRSASGHCPASGGAGLVSGTIIDESGEPLAELAEVLRDGAIEETVQWRHRPTEALDPVTGQGNAHVQYAFAAHRATVDVDTELGPGAGGRDRHRAGRGQGDQSTGRAGADPRRHRPGAGLAVMEEIQLVDGVSRNPSFTDYLIPTILDMPPMHVDVLELGDPHAPYGLRGVGEPPTISSTPAIVAAIRAATGRPLTRVPVRPEHIVAR